MAVQSSRDIYVLPEDSIATTLSLTSPKDACRLSVVDSTFRSASQSDVVWSRFLPSDYRDIISRASDGDSLLSKFRSKKELYLHLCDHPIIIDEGSKSFSLEKLTGKKCYMLCATDLFIVCGDFPEDLQIVKLPESRFSKVVELLNVGKFSVLGKMSTHMLSSGTNYAAYLVFTWKSSTYGFPHHSAEALMGIDGQNCEKWNVCLDPEAAQRQRFQLIPRHEVLLCHRFVPPQHEYSIPTYQIMAYPEQRKDGWMEMELGGCFVNGDEDSYLRLELRVKGGNRRSDLIIQGIEIRPKEP